MSASQSMIQPGMDVFSSDAEHVGRVKELRADSILIEVPKGVGPVTVPRDSIVEVSETERRVDLSMSRRDVQKQSRG
jgi:hypothetical protein